MGQVTAPVFPSQNVRCHVVQGNRQINVAALLPRIAPSCDVRSKDRRVLSLPGDGTDLDGILGNHNFIAKYLSHLFRVVKRQHFPSLDDHLWGVRRLKSKRANIRELPFSYERGRVWIFPAIVVEIIHMLAEHNQLRAWNRLGGIESLQQRISRGA